MANSSFTPTVLTLASAAGSGQGELNLVTNPSAATNTSGWTAGSNATLGNGTGGGPLNPTVSTYFTAINTAGSEGSTSGVYSVLTLPSGMQNRKLKVEFFYTSPASDTFSVSVYKGSTRVPLTTDSAGATNLPKSTTGKFTAYFDTDSSGTWTLSITRTAGGNGVPLQFTNVVVGPGIQPQGAVVGEWQSFTPSINGFGTVTNLVAKYRRVGDSLQAAVTFTSGTNIASAASVSLPQNTTIDATKLNFSSGTTNGIVGVMAASVTPFDGSVVASASASATLVYLVGNGSSSQSGSNGNLWANNATLTVNFTVPIAEWAGSGTVQLAQNDVEYASNTGSAGTAANTDYTTGAAYGPGGSNFVAVSTSTTATTATRYAVSFQTPIQPGDSLVFEYNTSPSTSNTWVSAFTQSILGLTQQGGTIIGVGIQPRDSTSVWVAFGNAGRTTSGTYGTAAGGWTDLSTWKWRVRKSSAGAAVGFGIVQPGVSSGLVSASGVPGNTTVNPIAAGYVGEKVTLTQQSVAGGAGVWAVNTTPLATLSTGVWLIFGDGVCTQSTTVAQAVAISTSTTAGSGIISQLALSPNTSQNVEAAMPVAYLQVTGASTSIYMQCTNASGSASGAVKGLAVRIA